MAVYSSGALVLLEGRKKWMPLEPTLTQVNCKVQSGFRVPVIRISKLMQAFIFLLSVSMSFNLTHSEITGNGGNARHKGGAFSTVSRDKKYCR